MTGMLTQIQENLSNLNSQMQYHRMESVARYVMAQAPTAEEMSIFLNRRQISQSIFFKDQNYST